MKKIFLLYVYLQMYGAAYSQILKPVKWSYGAKSIAENVYEIHLKADLDNGWHIYSQTQPANAIAQPTKFFFKRNNAFVLIGSIREIGKLEEYNNKKINISSLQYTNSVDFVQKIRVKKKIIKISGSLTFQVCTNEKCLAAEDLDFDIRLPSN